MSAPSIQPQPSLTATDSFRLRIQRSEQSRAALMAWVYTIVLSLVVIRRLSGGVVMTTNAVFFSNVILFSIGIAYQAFVWSRLRAANRQSALVERWRLDATIGVEIAIPSLVLLALHLWSPRGEYAALSAPALLLFPLTVLVSILRLRPRATLVLGLIAAAVHAGLAINTLASEHVEPSHIPVVFSYTVILILTAIAGWMVTRAARRYVTESAEEAAALEKSTARLEEVNRDLDIAREIQSGLLPEGPPDFPGFDFAGMNIPAEKTGGDYYDWQLLPNGRLLVVMADVTGHGIGPALVMAICRAYARASAPLDANLNSLLVRLNDLLCSDLRGARFITLAVALLDRSGHIELLSAGHGPSMLYRAATKGVEQFGGDGLPLAVMPDETYGPIRRLDIAPGDVLIMLTDGVFEWFNSSNEQFGTARVAQTLALVAHLSAQEIMISLHKAVLEFAGDAPQNDDLTIVVIKRSAS